MDGHDGAHGAQRREQHARVPVVEVDAAVAHQRAEAKLVAPGARLEAGQQLDVAMVYEANVQHLEGQFDFVPLQPKYAIAVQNVAANKTTPYPRLAKRLMTRLASATSRRRFEQLGFQWEAGGE